MSLLNNFIDDSVSSVELEFITGGAATPMSYSKATTLLSIYNSSANDKRKTAILNRLEQRTPAGYNLEPSIFVPGTYALIPEGAVQWFMPAQNAVFEVYCLKCSY